MLRIKKMKNDKTGETVLFIQGEDLLEVDGVKACTGTPRRSQDGQWLVVPPSSFCLECPHCGVLRGYVFDGEHLLFQGKFEIPLPLDTQESGGIITAFLKQAS